MTIEAAVIREQGVDFVVVSVKRTALQVSNRDEAVAEFSAIFEGLPAVLAATAGNGRAEFYGRTDLVNFLKNVPLAAMPWAEYSVSQ